MGLQRLRYVFASLTEKSLLQNRNLHRGQSAHPPASIPFWSPVSTAVSSDTPALRSACLCYHFPCAVFFVDAGLFTRMSDLHAVAVHFSGTATALALQRGDGHVQRWDCCVNKYTQECCGNEQSIVQRWKTFREDIKIQKQRISVKRRKKTLIKKRLATPSPTHSAQRTP